MYLRLADTTVFFLSTLPVFCILQYTHQPDETGALLPSVADEDVGDSFVTDGSTCQHRCRHRPRRLPGSSLRCCSSDCQGQNPNTRAHLIILLPAIYLILKLN